MKTTSLFIALLSATILLLGCGSDESPAPAGGETQHAEHAETHDGHHHAHGTVGPHGGPLFHLTPTALAEIFVDPETGDAAAYLFSEQMDPLQIEVARGEELTITASPAVGDPITVDLAPDASSLDITATRLKGNAPELEGIESFEGVLVGHLNLMSENTTIHATFHWPAPHHDDEADHAE
ncbi:hypothetical protein KQI84_17975 [bacterium]|nr:hypothetical protein [bacterium]